MRGGGSNKRTPFEVMGDFARRSGRGEAGSAPGSGSSVSDSAGASEPAGSGEVGWLRRWAAASGAPLTLRVPRGLAAAGVAAVVGLIVLAYAVGYQQGESAGRAMSRAGVDEQAARGQQRPPGALARETEAGPATPVNADGESGAAGGQGEAALHAGPGGQGRDPREIGKNYYVLVTWPLPDARRLSAFYEARGVAIRLVPQENDRVQVWAVDEGYTAAALTGQNEPRDPAYRRKLIELGRAYAEQTGVPSALVTRPQLTKYKGPPAQ